MVSVAAIIPARLASTRFPGKALADDTGRPLVVHVCQQARDAGCVDTVLVATDSREIIEAVEAHGFKAVMTRDDHPNGSSRVEEVARSLEHEIIVNVQGDEPELDPSDIDAAVAALQAREDCHVSTLATPFGPGDDIEDPNLVKVVVEDGLARCFTRQVPSEGVPMRHVGLYVFRKPFLSTYVALEQTPGEQDERLEQLRILEHGHSIAVAEVPVGRHGIDTPEQYQEFLDRHHDASSE